MRTTYIYICWWCFAGPCCWLVLTTTPLSPTACRALNLSCNRLADLLPLAALPALRQLNLQGNCIASVPAGADPLGFACLEELDISFNSLQPLALAFLERLPKLCVLDISGKHYGRRGIKQLVQVALAFMQHWPSAARWPPVLPGLALKTAEAG